MTQNIHDALTIGVPTMAIVIGVLFNNSRFNRLEDKIERVQGELSARIDRVQGDLVRVQSELTAKIDRVQGELTAKIDRVQSELTARIDRMQADLIKFYQILGYHEGKIDFLGKK